jgi:hypothetical protein
LKEKAEKAEMTLSDFIRHKIGLDG